MVSPRRASQNSVYEIGSMFFPKPRSSATRCPSLLFFLNRIVPSSLPQGSVSVVESLAIRVCGGMVEGVEIDEGNP